MINEDLYTILGIAPTASMAQIKERYRFLCHAYHPDKFATEDQRRTAAEQFKKINEAYRILSDPSARTDYDASRSAHFRPPPPPKASPPPPNPPQLKPRSGCLRVIKWLFLGLIAFVVLAGVAIYEMNRRNAMAFEASRHLIAASELDFEDLSLVPAPYSSTLYTLTGRIRNRSGEYAVRVLILKVTMSDTQPSDRVDIVGESDVYITIEIPPGQTRSLSETVYFTDLPKAIGRFSWTYAIKEIQANAGR